MFQFFLAIAGRSRSRISVEDLDAVFANSDSDISEYECDDSETDSSDHDDLPPRSDLNTSNSDSDDDAQLAGLAGGNAVPMDVTRDTLALVTLSNDNYIPICCPAYTQRAGPVIPDNVLESSNPIDCFMLLFPQEAFQLNADQTNHYATQFLDAPADFPEHSRVN